ncbi:beta-fructofuranosidase, soluble isoenzyme I-like isoform X2 [Telopea speciosissima]|uniref:beta-fructofuranosidase, soluble isoenzyme I-like isoform X2 n=1 Tax=Telopea speciosissima TaxID=54955 RepID=UPI001CC6408D|nr:beta-fructofuranosidase, soluble isoenzyme I-like isoform X2 [Telopea speciosissima]
METKPLPINSDIEYAVASPYNPLLGNDIQLESPESRRISINFYALISFSALLLISVMFFVGIHRSEISGVNEDTTSSSSSTPRGVSEGVSDKTFRLFSGNGIPFSWTESMLSWQRTGYHFQPKKSWMNGPLYYKGWYHLFYQYNPDTAVWGLIRWGHAMSKDMIHWHHLPMAMVPDQWYDINGVWTGSATLLPNGTIIMLYTGSTHESVQVQNLAYPADSDDPSLINWLKYPGNPVLIPPPGIGAKDFRDPTTAWQANDGSWKITIGSKVNKTGISLVYKTKDFINYELLDGLLHAVPGTGMWECVDFYPVSTTDDNGLGTPVKYVLKASLDDDKNDYYALGTYDPESDTWTPDNPVLDVGIGMRYDYGKYYASKTFYDQEKDRRILWGWISESDSEVTDVKKGWASVQSIPRTVVFDKKTRTNIIQWPVEEVENLRSNSKTFNNITIKAGSIVPLDIGKATQLDITVEFEIDITALEETVDENDFEYHCISSEGASSRGAMGPFGLLVLAHETLSEHTPVYFYLAKDAYGNIKTFFCADHSRSSKANDVGKMVYGSTVPVLAGEKLSMRIMVDHSIVESFAQGGRTCITSRVYPTEAINENTRLFVFNNATQASVTASIKTWQMNSAAVIQSYSMICMVLVILIHLIFLKI